ncbi:hypothetical protein JTE90_026474 [Oedothorax gibbosus]|uniref:Insulin-like domain-containing protein n=1 Tax=Oedothorax gibbosus TaxID=931172 RepID=A0AAV6VR92_9ARAC|nr:hypothetical protein JTE90_026474 [Oedothorax gibbosus]
MFVISLFYLSLIHTDSVTGIRICGRRLADFLHHLCKQFGGFHAPLLKRNVLFSTGQRREVEDSTSGVVNECCRNQCSVYTLISYCARGHLTEDGSLIEEILGFEYNKPLEKEAIEELANQNFDTTTIEPLRDSLLDSNEISRPNIGVSTRDRPVFIVLAQENVDISTEEYLENTI